MKTWLGMGIVACAAAAAAAQEAAAPPPAPAADSGMGEYTAFRPDRVGRLKASFGDAVGIQEMTGGVAITLISDNPEVKPLPMKSQSMRFNYKDNSGRPSTIVMEGNVDIEHPQANVKADRAEWNFETGDLVFTGSPVMNMPGVKDLKGTKITINLKNRTLDVSDMTASEVDPGAAEKTGGAGGGAPVPSDPMLLTEADVKDWAGLIGAIKAQAASDKPSPGRQIASRLPAQLQEPLRTMDAGALVGQKATLLRELNRVLSRPGMYNRAAWEGVAVGDEAKALIEKKEQTPQEQIRQNRLLLEAAFPQYIQAR